MSGIEISPEKILKDAPFVIRISQETVGGAPHQAQLFHSRGQVTVPLRQDKSLWIGELTLGEPGDYTLQVGNERIAFKVHEKEDLSFASEFVFLALCVGVILIGLIRWDWKKKKTKAAAGSF